jgi:hypothetical protein
MKKIVACVAYCLMVIPGRAQTEKWDTYLARYGNKPGSVLVDMALIATAPDKRCPYLVITGPTAHDCNAKGMPGADEINTMEAILDKTGSFLSGVTARILAGTFTYNCERLNYYYVRDTNGVRSGIARMYNNEFRNYRYTVRIKHDPLWLSYRTFLYPDERTQRWMESDKIMMTMLQMGDSLTTQRDINFKFHFTTEASRTAFAAAVRSHDYKADKTFTTGDGMIYGLVVSKKELVRMEKVDSMTNELVDEGKKYSGVYIGWDAPTRVGK